MDTLKTDTQRIAELSKLFADNLTAKDKALLKTAGKSVTFLMALESNTHQIDNQKNLSQTITAEFFAQLRSESIDKKHSNKTGTQLMNEKLKVAKELGCFVGNTPSTLRDVRSAIAWMECENEEKHSKEKSPKVKLSKSVSTFSNWTQLRKAYDNRPRANAKPKAIKKSEVKNKNIVQYMEWHSKIFVPALTKLSDEEIAKTLPSLVKYMEKKINLVSTVASATPKDEKKVANKK